MTAVRNSSDPGQCRNVKEDSPLKLRAYATPLAAFSREMAPRDRISKAGDIISH
jgi:hypothetical protein